MTVVSITTEALDQMQRQYTDLRRRYTHLVTLYHWTNQQRLEAEAEVNRLLGLGQDTWRPLWDENEHLYRVLSEVVNGS